MAGLYTLRVRLEVGGDMRGSGFSEMSHHFSFVDDTAAIDALPTLRDHFKAEALSGRWLATRGFPVHELVMYRRDITNRKHWVRLGKEHFDIGGWGKKTVDINIDGVSLSLGFQERPLFDHSLGAVLVTEATENPQVRRRVYVGPFSPMIYVGQSTLPGLAEIWTFQLAGPGFDEPLQQIDDTVDFWRDDMRDIARDHCAQLENFAGDGFSVVPSFKYGQVLAVLETRASSVRATIKSRGVRGWMSDRFGA